MAKAPPAFQFYPNDFVSGTRRMTTAEVGAYMLLLCAQWDDGSVPGDDLVALAQTMRCTRLVATKIWARICEKFVRDETGKWRNIRLENVRQEQTVYRAQRAQNGRKGAAERWQTHSGANGKPIAEPLANAWQNDGSPISDLQVRTKKQISVGAAPQRAPLRMSSREHAKADAEHIRKSQEVKRLVMEEGLTIADASRRLGYT